MASGRPSGPEADSFVFLAEHASGASIRKEYRFDPKTLLHTLRLTFSNPRKEPFDLPAWELSLGPGLGTVASELKENSSQWRALALMPPAAGRTQDRIETFKVKEEPLAHEKPWKWLAVENRYFLAAVFPPEDRFSGYRTGAAKVGKEAALAPWLKAQALPSRLEPGAALTLDIPFYLGPKSYTAMQGLGLGLERSVDFGWFTRLGRFALKVLHRLYHLTGNYGWAIILMTLGLQLVLFPLTWKQMKSAAAMKRVQPEIAKIQQKFSKDPSRMNVEMMELYKKHGANPLGGCLPVLAQMPVFVALFNALRNSWEL
ncbi:MAG: membrane protein insertase YidC, partial [Elusimicrobiota bacterium]